ncbi:MAG: hypothetical protein PHO94_12295 [Petrimonas sp.]|nr:hypothetical protein [Petrimonas sp.]
MTEQIDSPRDQGKTVAIVSYITFIGWIIAFILHNNNRTSLGAFHLRQSAFLYIIGAALSILRRISDNGALGFLLALAGIVLFIFWIMGIIRALNSEEKPLPIIGKTAQDILSGLK